MPRVLGTIKCENPDTLDELLATCHKIGEGSEKGLKNTASAAAGSPAQLPHLSRELATVARPAHHRTSAKHTYMPPQDKPASIQLIGTTASAGTLGTCAQKDISSKAAVECSPQVRPPVHDRDYYHKKHKLKRCTVRITRLADAPSKPADTKQVKLVSIKLHQLPLKPSQRVKVKPPASPEPKTSSPGIKHVISGRPQSTKHVFWMKRHVL